MAGILKTSTKQKKLRLTPFLNEEDVDSVSGEAAIYLSDSDENNEDKKEDSPVSFRHLDDRFSLLEKYVNS